MEADDHIQWTIHQLQRRVNLADNLVLSVEVNSPFTLNNSIAVKICKIDYSPIIAYS